MICSKCCVAIRGEPCEGCLHYQTTQQYMAERIRKSQSAREHFIAEILPDVDKEIDQGLELIEYDHHVQGEEIINKLLMAYPRYHSANYAKGVIFLQRDEWDKAIE